jgi:hypothetical protein
MLKAAVTLGLALLLCTAAAPGAAAAESDFCPGADSGLAGGYSTLDEVPAEVVDASVAYFVENLAANITNWAPCDADELQVSAAGCSQVRARPATPTPNIKRLLADPSRQRQTPFDCL